MEKSGRRSNTDRVPRRWQQRGPGGDLVAAASRRTRSGGSGAARGRRKVPGTRSKCSAWRRVATWILCVIQALPSRIWGTVQHFLYVVTVEYLFLKPLRVVTAYFADYTKREQFRRTETRYLSIMSTTESHQTWLANAVCLDHHRGMLQWQRTAPLGAVEEEETKRVFDLAAGELLHARYRQASGAGSPKVKSAPGAPTKRLKRAELKSPRQWLHSVIHRGDRERVKHEDPAIEDLMHQWRFGSAAAVDLSSKRPHPDKAADRDAHAPYCNAKDIIFETSRIIKLAQLGNLQAIEYFLRSCLHRNNNGMSHPLLYRYYTGTKSYVEDYNEAVVQLIKVFSGSMHPSEVSATIRSCTGALEGYAESCCESLQVLLGQQHVSGSDGMPVSSEVAPTDLSDVARGKVPCSPVQPPSADEATPHLTDNMSSCTTNSSLLGVAATAPIAFRSILRHASRVAPSLLEENQSRAGEGESESGAPRLDAEGGDRAEIGFGPLPAALSSAVSRSEFIDRIVLWAHQNMNVSATFTEKDRVRALCTTLCAFGRTALMLSGGSTLGVYHTGVCRALFEADLLPQIMSGSSAGSIIAAIVCTRSKEDLRALLCDETFTFEAMQLNFFDSETGPLQRLRRLMHTGAVMDVKILMECMRNNIGDLTFAEAYAKTGRVLNVCVTSDRQEGSHTDRHLLLNCVTTPNVVVWSAVSASCALPGLFTAVQLLQKTPDGQFVPYLRGQLWCDGSVARDLPREELANLFNVNYFIVSQVNPHVVLFMPKPISPLSEKKQQLTARLWFWACEETRHWILKLFDLGLLSTSGALEVGYMFLTQRYDGDITILPIGNVLRAVPDYVNIVTNPSREYVAFVMTRGQLRTWPHLNKVRWSTMIERALKHEIDQRRASHHHAYTPRIRVEPPVMV